jgi:glutamate 2,3-aminomutase
LNMLDATEEQWDDWRWQISHRISKIEVLEQILHLNDEEKENIREVSKNCRWSISPYYVSLMDPDSSDCPIRKQAIPSIDEMIEFGKADPMEEEYTSPVESITRRYPDRLIIKVTNQCAMYCRHCQRRRDIGQKDIATPRIQLEEAIEYVRENKEIRDILLTGGDALLIKNETLDWILSKLRSIPHVEIIRIGSRSLVTMPQRITQELCNILQKYHPIYINTHFNSPSEITEDVAKATDRLCRAGVPLGNQAVLLKGVNNDANIMKKLNHELLKVRVRPYYIFHPKSVKGTKHFKVRVEEGLEIMEKLRGYTSGLAIPTYIINAPKGKGKIPILPNYVLGFGKDYVKLRTWEGEVFDYPNL